MVIREGGTPQSKLGRENQRLRARIEELEEALRDILASTDNVAVMERRARRALESDHGDTDG